MSAASPTESPTFEHTCLAEMIGTAIIVQGGCGAVCAAKYAGSGANVFGIAAAWGISVTLAIYATRAISGAHLNPAVTCALVTTGDFPAEEAPFFIASQEALAPTSPHPDSRPRDYLWPCRMT